MCYSVVWSPEDKAKYSGGPIDLKAKEELWLAKLGSWTEALSVYERKLSQDPHDFEALLGCMRCLGASGEWRKVIDLSVANWDAVCGEKLPSGKPAPQRSRRKAARICAQAAWRLGQWDELEKFADQLVGRHHHQATGSSAVTGTLATKIDFDGSFYSAVLHVHRKEWSAAAESVDAARKAMDQRLTALMSESYSRAYPSMVVSTFIRF